MATADKGLRDLYEYLKNDFQWKKDYHCEYNNINISFTYSEVKEALRKLKKTDPKLHRILQYRILTNRSRQEISLSLFIDSSTLKRSWDKAIKIIQNWLMHGTPYKNNEDLNLDNAADVLFEELDVIDLLYIK